MNNITNEVPDGYVLLERRNGTALHAACMDGGRFHGWLFAKGPDGQWVSQRKLESWEVMQVEDQRDDGIAHETNTRAALAIPASTAPAPPAQTALQGWQNAIEVLTDESVTPASTAASEQQASVSEACSGCDPAEGFCRVCRERAALSGRATIPSEADERVQVRDAVSQALTGVYYCGRVWSAWSVGTMHESDFTPAAEVDEVLDEITDRAMAALTHRATTATPGDEVIQAGGFIREHALWVATSSDDPRATILYRKADRATTPDIATTAAADEHGLTVADWTHFHDATADPDDTDHSGATTAADQQGAAQAQAGEARDAARYRVLRLHVLPHAVSIQMTRTPPAWQAVEERIDMLCDIKIEAQRAAMAAPATSGGK